MKQTTKINLQGTFVLVAFVFVSAVVCHEHGPTVQRWWQRQQTRQNAPERPRRTTTATPPPRQTRERDPFGRYWFDRDNLRDREYNIVATDHANRPIGHTYFKGLAHRWILSNHERATIFLSTTVNVPNDFERLTDNHTPFAVTISGRCRIKGRDHDYRLAIRIEGIDDNQAVYVVTNWRI